jgi:hypothetical protein
MIAIDFFREVDLAINEAKARNASPATIAGWLTTIQTALGTDTRTHDRTIQAPPAALDQANAGSAVAPPFFHRRVMAAINAGLGDPTQTTTSMATALGNLVTALGTDVSTHDITLEKVASILNPGFQHTGGIP